jgi:hypothetical protein
MTITVDALAEDHFDVADEWTPTSEDWEWYWSTMHDDFEENVLF